MENKKESYLPVKDAALWMKANSEPNDQILSVSYPQTSYYAERNVTIYSDIENVSEFDKLVWKFKPKYLEATLFEPHHPNFILQQLSQNGYDVIALPYMNSSIAIKNGKIVSVDMKPAITRGNMTFKFVYPQQINGVFVYEIDYNETNRLL